jgi:hypothetical protein
MQAVSKSIQGSVDELQELPEDKVQEVIDFIGYLKKMTDYLLDTNYVSRLLAKAEPLKSRFEAALKQGDHLGISVTVQMCNLTLSRRCSLQ